MIFTDRTITVRKGESRIDEPIVVYRGDYELEVRFTILNSRFKFMSGTNMIESEKASYGQLAIRTPYGGNIFSNIVRCNDGSVTFVLTAEMLNQIEEVGLYSFQIRLIDYNKESRVSIPPIEFGIEVREPIASEDHDNSVNNAIVGYSIAKMVDPKEEKVGDTFDENGNYNKTKWGTWDRISEGRLNKIEDAIDKINQNEKEVIATLDKRINSTFNVLNSRVDNIATLIYGNDERLKYGHCLAKPFNFDGKTAAFFGDSITQGVMSPNLGWTPNSYGQLFSTAVGLSFENRAISGSCFSPVNSPVQGNDICDKILSYTTAKDFIFIAGGTNDYSVGNEVGTLGDTTTNTVYGALHVICEHLRNNLPNTTVIFITPINQNIPQSRSITHMNVYRNAIFEVATSYGFNVVDGSQIGFPTEKGSFADLMCQDGVHPNQLGHEMYAKSLRGILL